MKTTAILAAVLAVACGAEQTPTAQPTATTTHRVDLAAFLYMEAGHVTHCLDVVSAYDLPPERAEWKPAAPLHVELSAHRDDELAVPGSCAQQLPGRAVLATCRLPSTLGSAEGVPHVRDEALSFYSLEAVSNDETMADCIGRLHGRWTAVTRDGTEVARAKLDEARARIAAMRRLGATD